MLPTRQCSVLPPVKEFKITCRGIPGGLGPLHLPDREKHIPVAASGNKWPHEGRKLIKFSFKNKLIELSEFSRSYHVYIYIKIAKVT